MLTHGRALFPQGLMDCQAESRLLSSAEAEWAVALHWMTVKGTALRDIINGALQGYTLINVFLT